MEYSYEVSTAQMAVSLVVFLYIAFCLMTIAHKTGTSHAWMAWVPILNLYLVCKVAGKPGWWMILLMIPFVNIVFGIIAWMRIAEARGFASFWGVLAIIPLANFVAQGYMAFGESHGSHAGRPVAHL